MGVWLIAAGFAFMVGAGCLVSVGAYMKAQEAYEEEDSSPWGFNQVQDTAVCDGGEPDWEEY